MNRKVSVLLVVSLLICSLGLTAKERRGAELVIQKLDGQQIKGELIAVKQNSLLLLSPEGADVSVEIGGIKLITIAKKSKVLIGAGIGFLAGVVSGGLIGWAAGYDTDILGGMVGLIAGTTYGLVAGKDKKIQIAGKSDTEIKEILEKLRRQARMKNAQ